MTPEKVLDALINVQEPDLGKDIVTLNMVKDIVINGNVVSFTVVLTTPACPMKDMIGRACENAVKFLKHVEPYKNQFRSMSDACYVKFCIITQNNNETYKNTNNASTKTMASKI